MPCALRKLDLEGQNVKVCQPQVEEEKTCRVTKMSELDFSERSSSSPDIPVLNTCHPVVSQIMAPQNVPVLTPEPVNGGSSMAKKNYKCTRNEGC